MAFAVWDRLLQTESVGELSASHAEDLPEITKLIEVHIAQTQPDDLRNEDWWVPRLLSPNSTVQATLGVLLGIFVKAVPRRASEIADDILKAMDKQSNVLGLYRDHSIRCLTRASGTGGFAPTFRKPKKSSSPINAFMHLHPEVRTRGEKLLEQLTDGAPEFNSKIVLNALVRQLRREEGYVELYSSVIVFITRNIASRLYLNGPRLLGILDSRMIRFVILGSSCCVRSIHQTV